MTAHTDPPGGASAPIRLPGPIALVSAGHQAFGQVPGLRMLMLKGFVLLYGIFAVLGTALTMLIYRLAIRPQFERLEAWRTGGGWFMEIIVPLLDVLLNLAQVMLLAGVLVLAFLVSLSMMSVWFEALAERIMQHRRGGAESVPFSFSAWAGSILKAMRDSLWLFLVAALSIVLGFVPVAGPFLVLLINGYLLGWEVRQPYITVNAESARPKAFPERGRMLLTVRMGLLPVVLAMIPVVGWLALPMVLIYMVAGMAWANEQEGG